MNVTELVTLIVAITGLLGAIPAIIIAMHTHNTVANDVKPTVDKLVKDVNPPEQ